MKNLSKNVFKLLSIPILLFGLAFPQSQIALRNNMMSPSDAQKLIDGQTEGTGTYWVPNWQSNSGNDPRVAVIDLGQNYSNIKIEYFDYQDDGNFVIESSTDNASWTSRLNVQTKDYRKWNTIRYNSDTRYLRVSQNDHGAIVSEIRVYGTASGSGGGTQNPTGPTDDGNEAASLDSLTDSLAIVSLTNLEPGKDYVVSLNNRRVLEFTSPISGHDTIRPPDTVTYTPVVSSDVTFDQFAGMCMLPDDPLHIASAGGYVRPYILSKWYLYDVQNVNPNLPISQWEMAFCPSYAGGWCQDPFYESFSKAGIEVVPTFKESFMFLTNNSKPDLDNKPWKLNEDGTDPYTHRYTSAYFYQFAARFGKTQVPDNTLLLRGDQTRSTGLGYVNYMQLENEWDKWWLGGDSEFTAQEYAAYHSAIYDGHMGTITDPSSNVKFGIVTADPTMKVIAGPLAHLDYTKLDAIFAWWDANRAAAPGNGYRRYPLDGLSFHRYANTSGTKQRNLSGKGQSPEAFGFFEFAKEFVEYCDAKGLEAWLTEFGYDTNSGSPQGIIPFAGKDTEEIQAEWLMRTYLLFSAAGIDRAAQYMMRDVTNNGGGIFQTSGFTSTKDQGWVPKKSWYYFKTMVTSLTDAKFKEWENSGRNDIYKFRYEKDDGTKIYAVWMPTADGSTENAYVMSVDGSTAALVTPTSGVETGVTGALTITGGNVTIPVSEKVRFVVVLP